MAAETETAVSEIAPKKRGRGRPPGSRNKLSADARALLAKHGLAGLRSLCAIAAGRPIYRARAADGSREKLVPNLDQMLVAQRAILDRLVASLKATELTGQDGAPLFPGADEATSPRNVAEAVIDLLRSAQPAGRQQPSIIDIDQLNGGGLANGGLSSAAGRSATMPPAAPSQISGNDDAGPVPITRTGNIVPISDPYDHWRNVGTVDQHPKPDQRPPRGMSGMMPKQAYTPGERILVGEKGHSLEYILTNGDGRHKFWIVDQNGMRITPILGEDKARAAVDELIRTGSISR